MPWSFAEDINGLQTFVAEVGQPLDFRGRVTDRGSDDIFVTWDWADGNTSAATYGQTRPRRGSNWSRRRTSWNVST